MPARRGGTTFWIPHLEMCGNKKHMQMTQSLHFSLLDYQNNGANGQFPHTTNIDDGTVLVGAGAVGSAVVYSLNQVPGIRGAITVVDDDVFEQSNLNRCVIAFQEDITFDKASVAARYSNRDLTFVPKVMRYEEFAEKYGRKFPLVISTVDNNDARFSIQDDLPRTIIHGATGGPVAAVTILDILKNACMYCIFEGSGDAKGHNVEGKACGMLQVQQDDGTTAEAAVSFVSFFAGLCASTEVIKHVNHMKKFPLQNKSNQMKINLLMPLHLPPPLRRPKEIGCAFHNILDKENAFRKKWQI